MTIDLPPPTTFMVCIEAQPQPRYPQGVYVLPMESIKKLGKLLSDYEAGENHRLEFEASLAKERPDLNFKPPPKRPDSEIGVMVMFKNDCPK